MLGWALERRNGPPLWHAEVLVAHICQVSSADRRAPRWLDEGHRHLIAPLALWDVTDQLEAAAALFRLRAGR